MLAPSPELLEESDLEDELLTRVDEVGADGIHLPLGFAEPDLLKKTRIILGKNAIIGADCNLSRHQAMSVGEADTDYIAFSASPEEPGEQLANMVSWWQELFEIPCVAANICDQSQLELLLQIPAEFIAIGAPLWSRLRDDPDFIKWMGEQCPLTQVVGQE